MRKKIYVKIFLEKFHGKNVKKIIAENSDERGRKRERERKDMKGLGS